MATFLSISASPQAVSSTHAVLSHVNRRLLAAGHTVRTLPVRELPPGPLLAADSSDPEIAEAIEAVAGAHALVVATPVYQAAHSGLLKVFLDVLPQSAFRGKSVLPIVTGGSPAHVLAVDYALRPILSSLGAAHIGQGWFVPSSHIRVFADGGLVIDPSSLTPLAQVTDEFLDLIGARPAATAPLPGRVDSAGGPRISAVAGHPDIEVRRVMPGDPALAPLLSDLVVEYGTRYGRPSPNTQLTEVPATDFLPPEGLFIVLVEDGVTVAGGAIRRYDEKTAEVKRVWTAHRHRRRGLALRVMAELEAAAVELGYLRVHLTTGPRQAEARNLYLAGGYIPRFDQSADPETIGPLAFAKELVPGAGLPDWRHPGWAVPLDPDTRRHVHAAAVTRSVKGAINGAQR